MAEFLSQDILMGLSKLPEAAYNTLFTTAADYETLTTQTPQVLIPQMEKSNNANRVGLGSEFPTLFCNKYWIPPEIPIQDVVDTYNGGRLALRAVGGLVTSSASGTGFLHTAAMLPPAAGRQLPSSDLLAALGGAKYIYSGLVVDRFRLSQQRADDVQYEATLVGSGNWQALAFTPNAPAAIPCSRGNSVEIKYTRNATVVNVTQSSCRVRSWFVELNNNLKRNDRCAGDPYRVSETDPCDAAFVRKLLRGARTAAAQIVLTLDETLAEVQDVYCNQQVTNLTFTVFGNVIGAGPTRHALEIVIPVAQMSAVTPADDDGDATIQLDFAPMRDPITGGAMRVNVINDLPTLR